MLSGQESRLKSEVGGEADEAAPGRHLRGNIGARARIPD
jgi:hypothetical protein